MSNPFGDQLQGRTPVHQAFSFSPFSVTRPSLCNPSCIVALEESWFVSPLSVDDEQVYQSFKSLYQSELRKTMRALIARSERDLHPLVCGTPTRRLTDSKTVEQPGSLTSPPIT